MFTETITTADGTTETGSCTEAHALTTLRRAVKKGYRVEATRTGGAIIERDVWTGDTLPKKLTVVIEPVKPVGTITPTMRDDLEAIGRYEAYRVDAAERPFRDRVDRIHASFRSVPPAAARRLVERGLVTLGEPYQDTSNGYLAETRTPVRVSLAARLATHARTHRTRTTEPNGYVKPADIGMTNTNGLNKPGRRAGRVYDGSSRAGCSCGTWSTWAEDRGRALRAAREHRQKATAEFITNSLA